MSVELLGKAVDACEALTQTVEGKVTDINQKVDEAKSICSDAAGNLLNEAKTVGAWYVPEAPITLYPAKRIGVEDLTTNNGDTASADMLNPTKLDEENLLFIPDFESPSWSGGVKSWDAENRFVGSASWAAQRVSDVDGNSCYVDLIDLHEFPKLINFHDKDNVRSLGENKIPYLIMRVTVEGQTIGLNRTFIEVLKNSNGAHSNWLKKLEDDLFDCFSPQSAIYGAGFIENGYPVPVESAGWGGIEGHYNGMVLIPLNKLSATNQNLMIVNVGHKKMHIHSYGISYFNPIGLELA